MKKKSTSKSAFFNLRILTASMFCLLGIAVALFAQGNRAKQTQQSNRSGTRQDGPGTQTPEVTQMIGPAVVNGDLRDLPHVPPGPKIYRPLLKPGRHGTGARTESEETPSFPQLQSLLGKTFRPVPNMPPPLLTFDGISSAKASAVVFRRTQSAMWARIITLKRRMSRSKFLTKAAIPC